MALKYPTLGQPFLQAVRERRGGKVSPAQGQPNDAQAAANQPVTVQPAPDSTVQRPPRQQKPAQTAQPQRIPVTHTAPPASTTPPTDQDWPDDLHEDLPAPESPAPRRAERGPRVFLSVLLGTLLLFALLGASWFLLPIRKVSVTGNHQLSSLEVKRLAGLDGARPFGWLYYGPWRAEALRDNAWVQAAHITRRFPDEITLTINERQPTAWFRDAKGELTALAADATPLPLEGHPEGSQPNLPIISGWGPDRSDDALYAVGALSRYNVKSVEYTPTGLTIQTGKGTIWSGDRELLLKYAGAIENQSEGSRINLYPWGVSVQK